MPAGKPKFKIGEIVWHRANNARGVVQGFELTENDVLYIVAFGPQGRDTNYAVELTNQKPIDGVENNEED